MRAHQIMTRKVVTVGPDTPVTEAATIMLKHHVSGLPVVDRANKLVGIVSEGDFIRRSEIGTQRTRSRWLQLLIGPGKAAEEFVLERGRKVGEVMTPDPYTISESTPLAEVVQLMEKRGIKRLPVVRDGQIVGIVNSWTTKTWPNTFGIRYPTDDSHDPYFIGFVLQQPGYKEQNFKKSDQESLDDLFADETSEEV